MALIRSVSHRIGTLAVTCRILVRLCLLLLAIGVFRVVFALDATSGAASSVLLSEWIAQLGSADFSARQSATRALIQTGPPVIPFAMDAVGNKDPEIQARAAFVLQQLAQVEETSTRKLARGALQKLAASDDQRGSRVAMRALKQFADEAARQLQIRGARLEWDEHGQVRTVNFAQRRIRDDDLRPLRELTPIELDLRFTGVTDAGLKYVQGQIQLELLNLQGTKVTDKGLSELRELINLRVLSVERTAVSDAGMLHLQSFGKLQTLYLGGSQVRGRGLQQLCDLPINYLSFQGSTLDDSIGEHVATLRQIQTLGLDDTPIGDACLTALAELPTLEVLWLDKTQVTNECIPLIKRLSALRTLHIDNTKMTVDGVERLTAEMPNTQVIHSTRR